jgi:dinuclear metal center YbgI/SA1388 family protein
MASRDEIVEFASAHLDVASYPDYGPVGLQVVGADEVSRIVCSVSCSLELFAEAARRRAELVLVHHGLFWDREPRVIGRALRDRLKALFDADLNLVAYHLALDAHPEVGNNALLARELGVRAAARFAGVGWAGPLERPCPIGELAERVRDRLGRDPLVFASGPEPVRTVAICSGGAARVLDEAIAAGYDCLLTGEPAEPTMMAAREAGVHFVAAGHYATETLGVQALAALLADRFGLAWEFVDLPTPV